MSMLDQREQALEQAFVHDEEVRFLMLTHRNKLFGRWAADLLQYKGEVAERYIQSILDTLGASARVRNPDDRIVSRVVNDLMNAELTLSADDVHGALARCEEESEAAFRAKA